MFSRVHEIFQNKNISVIVPFFREGGQVRENIKILRKELEQYFSDYEIIAVADNGKDETYLEILDLKKVCPVLKVYEYGRNRGKGFALTYGFRRSKGDYIVFIDGGMELHPKDIRVFLGLMDVHRADIVIGSKRHPQSKVYYPSSRRFLSWAYQILTRLFLDVNVRDTQVGLKLFKREVLERCMSRVLVKKYAFDLELLTVASHLGYKRILEAPVELDYFRPHRTCPRVKDFVHTLEVLWPMFVDTLAIIFRLRILKYYDRS